MPVQCDLSLSHKHSHIKATLLKRDNVCDSLAAAAKHYKSVCVYVTAKQTVHGLSSEIQTKNHHSANMNISCLSVSPPKNCEVCKYLNKDNIFAALASLQLKEDMIQV